MIIENWQLGFIGIVILFLWCFKVVKSNFFWLYLWQLKNYHIGRFLAHFETDNGKKIFYNIFFLVKIFFLLLSGSFIFLSSAYGFNYNLLASYAVSPIWIFIFMASLFLCIEGGFSLISVLAGKFKKPVMTSKALFLALPVFFPFLILIFFVFSDLFNVAARISTIGVADVLFYLFLILLFEVFTPLMVSLIVLIFQPFTVVMRNKTLNRASFKIETLKNLLVIGITGSFGKSSTKEFLKIILSESFRVVTTEKNQNSEIGISECILRNVNDSHEIFICEMGAYNRGGIKLLAGIARPKIGILTAIGNQHLSTFGSQQNIIDTKFELIDSLPKEGLAVLNWDSEYIRKKFDGRVASLKCSMSKKEDVWAENVKISSIGISFEACFKNGERISIETGILGEYNVSNLLLCISVARRIGMSKEEIANGCKKITAELSGMQIQKTSHGFSMINSSYSANKVGVLAHLGYFKDIEAFNKKVLVMPCIIELGKEGKQTHYEIGRKIAICCDIAIITNKDYFDDIKRGAVEGGMNDCNIVCIEDPLKAFEAIKQRIDNGLLLLEGRSSIVLVNKIFEN